MKSRIILAIIALAASLTLQSQTPTPTTLLGNWSNPETQEWEYGFFEHFAIYQNDFWEYESLRVKGKHTEVVLKQGDKRHALKIALSPKVDSLCTLTPAKGKKIALVRYTHQPDYMQPDHRPFVDNGFQRDSVTVIGYLRNTKRTLPFLVSVHNILSSESENFPAKIDSCGRFRITVPILNTSELFLDWQEGGILFSTVAEPGETLFIYHDYKGQDTRFMGNNARIHQEMKSLADPHYRWYKAASYRDNLEHHLFMKQHQEAYRTAREKLVRYIAAHPMVSDRFREFTRTTLLFSHASQIMQRRFKLSRSRKERLPETYIAYADSLYTLIDEPYSLSSDISSFLRDYFDYYNEEEASNTIMASIEALRYLDQQGRYALTVQQKTDLKDYEKLMDLSYDLHSQGLDSTAIAQKAEPYKEGTLRAVELLKSDTLLQFFNKEKDRLIPQLIELKSMNNELLFLNLLSISPLMKEIVVTQIYREHLYQIQKPLCEQAISQFNQWVTNPSFKEEILSTQAYYENLAKQTLSHTESIRNNDLLKDETNPAEILRKLIEPHKGKVIYIDFWGTWCGPCKEEMKQMPPIKKAMEGKEVIFMYLANRSPEDSWKNVIKENQLTGPQIVHYSLPSKQQELLEQHLGINSFPSYRLVNKQGKLIQNNVPFPRQKEELIKRLTELLIE